MIWDWFDESGYFDGDTKVISLEIGNPNSDRVTQAVAAAKNGD